MCNLSEAIGERSMKECHAQGKLAMLLQLLEQNLLTKEQSAQAVNMELEAFEQYVQPMKEKKGNSFF